MGESYSLAVAPALFVSCGVRVGHKVEPQGYVFRARPCLTLVPVRSNRHLEARLVLSGRELDAAVAVEVVLRRCPLEGTQRLRPDLDVRHVHWRVAPRQHCVEIRVVSVSQLGVGLHCQRGREPAPSKDNRHGVVGVGLISSRKRNVSERVCNVPVAADAEQVVEYGAGIPEKRRCDERAAEADCLEGDGDAKRCDSGLRGRHSGAGGRLHIHHAALLDAHKTAHFNRYDRAFQHNLHAVVVGNARVFQRVRQRQAKQMLGRLPRVLVERVVPRLERESQASRYAWIGRHANPSLVVRSTREPVSPSSMCRTCLLSTKTPTCISACRHCL